MTWEHLQQLRESAQAEIARRIEQLRPSGGQGVTVQGDSIAIEGRQTVIVETPPVLISIWIAVEGETVTTSTDGETRSTFEFPLQLAVQVMPGGRLQSTYAHEQTQIANITTPGGSIVRTARITFQQRPFIFPVQLRLEQRDQSGTVYGTDTLAMPTGSAKYSATAAANDVFLEVHIAAISLL